MNIAAENPDAGIYLDCEGDKMKIIGRRIAHGKPVGDSYLFGRLAHDLLKSGHATFSDIRKYRSALYFSEKREVGDDMAKSREEERLKRHEDAAIFKGFGKYSNSPDREEGE